MRRFVIKIIFILLLAALLAGCGGQKSTTNNKIALVTVIPTTVSLIAGDVVQITPSAQNSGNSAVTATFTFNSSNTKIATVAPNGLICGGVWDSLFIVCN